MDAVDCQGIGSAKMIIDRLFKGSADNLAFRLWNNETMYLGNENPQCTLVFNHVEAFRDLLIRPDPVRLAEAYFQGLVDVEGDFYPALQLKKLLESCCLSAREKASFMATALSLDCSGKGGQETGFLRRWQKPLQAHFSRKHDREVNKKAIGFHYDVSNDFYRLWLDELMIYSCAYFESPDESLEKAQCNKLDHICRKLRLQPGETLLDIGCGWGALVIWAATHYGVKAHGITLSRNQYEHAQKRIRDESLEKMVSVELRDYRDLEGEGIYDKISSIGMFEHVGLENLPVYFSTASRLLKPGGLFLNHGITHDEEGWRTTVETELINRYVFPDGELDTISNIGREMERTSFEILDVESMRSHYALTLRHWVQRLEAHHHEACSHVSEACYRVWRLYMAGCALQFEEGGMGLYQILAAKRNGKQVDIPFTRRDLYFPRSNVYFPSHEFDSSA